MASILLRPVADTDCFFTLTGAANHYDAVDDAVTDPAAASFTEMITTPGASADEWLDLDATGLPALARPISATVRLYVRATGTTTGQLSIILYDTDFQQMSPETAILALSNSTRAAGWATVTIPISRPASKLDAMSFKITSVMSLGAFDIAAAYVELNYSLAGSVPRGNSIAKFW